MSRNEVQYDFGGGHGRERRGHDLRRYPVAMRTLARATFTIINGIMMICGMCGMGLSVLESRD